MRVVPLDERPSRGRLLLLGLVWLSLGAAALTCLGHRPTDPAGDIAHQP